ncbi:reverse transcriptase [Tanacetum coccineum]
MRVRAYVRKNVVHTLVDCGSTYNFLDWNTARKLRCTLKKICPPEVSIANGIVMSSRYKSKDFSWEFHGMTYTTDVMILPLRGCEMVVFRGTQQDTIQWMQGNQRQGKKMVKAELSAMSVYVCPVTFMQIEARSSYSKDVKVVLKDFESVFDVPRELPLKRTHDHRIPLVPNTPPVNIRPYKHPPSQKDSTELMVKELLESGVIRNSQSPFSSPIVIVKRKDGTWRMCVDYRKLNKPIVKDNFPIPIVEELIDELSGFKFFLKLDLRSGYHQIRMEEGDVYKTIFRTHEGHYEFLVMPFGLTNAPSIFQSLMNLVFKGFLRKFVLVFFDDILIYSKSLESHLEHLKQVLTVMESNYLFAKRSKCVFAATSVEYLSHIISSNGVATDPSKFIKNYAVKSRPLTTLLKKNAFQWSNEVQGAFEELNEAMTQAPVLALPYFNNTFTIETDASGLGIRAVLQQEGHPIAFLSKTLASKHQSLSTYEEDFLAVLIGKMERIPP